MKIISLNIWGGTASQPLFEFLKSHETDTDIFCFQEVFESSAGARVSNGAHMNVFAELVAALPDFDAYFVPIQEQYDLKERIDFPATQGEALFIRRSLPVVKHGELFVYGAYNEIVSRGEMLDIPVALQYACVEKNGTLLTVAHLHGIVFPGTKVDSPARIEQSRNILDFLSKEPGEKILCGDFNLMPDTESIRMIERSGMRNLIQEFNISKTRSRAQEAKYGGDFQKFADYCFVSPGIDVKNFSVPDVDASDHLPLILEFS